MGTRDEQREQSKNRIIEAALQLFSEQGYGNTSIRQIAKKADISLGLLYNYYDGKETLLKAVVHACREDVLGSFETTLGDNGADLQVFLPVVFALVKAKPTFWRLIYMIRFQKGVLTSAQQEIDELLSLIYNRLTHFFRQKNHPNPEAGSRLLFAAIVGVTSQMLTEDDYPDEIVIHELIQTFGVKIE